MSGNVTTYILAAIIILQAIIHHFERKDLYNRIMCKSIGEYKNADKPVQKHVTAYEKALKKWRGENN